MPPRKEQISETQWPEIALMAERVQAARIEANLTQEEFAKKCKMDRSWLTNLENRKVSPNLQSLIVIARALKKPIGYFFERGQR